MYFVSLALMRPQVSSQEALDQATRVQGLEKAI